MPNLLPNGIGGLVADELITAKNLQLSSPARIWYVDSQTGDDSNSGKDRKFPKATVGAALGAFSGDDNVVMCMTGHAEEFSGAVSLDDRTSLVGEGAVAGVPSVELTLAAGATNLLELGNGDGISEVRNIRFRPPGNAAVPGNTTGSFITGDKVACRILGCHFDFDEFSQGDGVIMSSGANYWIYKNCFFTNVDDTDPVVARPKPAIKIDGGSPIILLEMCGCVFDGGLHGFDDGSQNPYAFDGSIQQIQQVRILNMSLLRGADFKLESTSTGHVSVAQATGHAKVEW